MECGRGRSPLSATDSPQDAFAWGQSEGLWGVNWARPDDTVEVRPLRVSTAWASTFNMKTPKPKIQTGEVPKIELKISDLQNLRSSLTQAQLALHFAQSVGPAKRILRQIF